MSLSCNGACEPVQDKFTTRRWGSFRPQLPRRRGRSVAAVIITMIPNVATNTIRSWNELLDRTTLIGQVEKIARASPTQLGRLLRLLVWNI